MLSNLDLTKREKVGQSESPYGFVAAWKKQRTPLSLERVSPDFV